MARKKKDAEINEPSGPAGPEQVPTPASGALTEVQRRQANVMRKLLHPEVSFESWYAGREDPSPQMTATHLMRARVSMPEYLAIAPVLEELCLQRVALLERYKLLLCGDSVTISELAQPMGSKYANAFESTPRLIDTPVRRQRAQRDDATA